MARDRRLALLASIALAALVSIDCSFIVDRTLQAGIGAPCSSNADCQNGSCDNGSCTAPCSRDDECPEPSRCFAGGCRLNACAHDQDCSAGNACVSSVCTKALSVGAIAAGRPNGEDGWTTAVKAGLDVAAAQYGYMRYRDQPYAFVQDASTSAAAGAAIDQLLLEKVDVIVTTSPAGHQEALRRAPGHPDVRFIASGGTSNGDLGNVGAYSAKTEQAWFVAGQLAARVGAKANHCVGMILPYPSKPLVRDTNAFARGARFQEPSMKVVVRWVGTSKDVRPAATDNYVAKNYALDTNASGRLFREELLAAQLADLGCAVVVHRTDTQRLVSMLDRRLKGPVKTASGVDIFSMGSDFEDACRAQASSGVGDWTPSCLASVYWNFGPTYAKLFDQIHSGTWTPEVRDDPFRADADALIKIQASPFNSITGIGSGDVQIAVEEAADRGFDAVFRGPISFTGQRDLDRNGSPDADQSVPDGIALSGDELARMCWFVDGVYELPDPSNVDFASLTPALVPYGPAVPGATTTLDPSNPQDMKKYGDVITYLQSLQDTPAVENDPAKAMSCALK